MRDHTPTQFDFSSVTTFKVGRPKSKAWGKAFMLLAPAAVGLWLGIGALRPTPAQPAPTEPGAFPYNPALQYLNTDPAADPEVRADPSLKAIADSTVYIVVLDKKGSFLWNGSGTVLANTDVGGHPVVLSSKSGADYIGAGANGAYAVVYNHDGKYLGTANEMSGDTAGPNQNAPGLALLSFDDSFPVNNALMNQIPGAEVANELASGRLYGSFGDGSSKSFGSATGDDGGGVYSHDDSGQWKLVGVISQTFDFSSVAMSNDTTPVPDLVAVKAKAADPTTLGDGAFAENGMQYAMVPRQSSAVINGLGNREFLHDLETVSTRHHQVAVFDQMDYPDVRGFGYGSSVAGMMRGYFTSNLESALMDFPTYAGVDADLVHSQLKVDLGDNKYAAQQAASTEKEYPADIHKTKAEQVQYMATGPAKLSLY